MNIVEQPIQLAAVEDRIEALSSEEINAVSGGKGGVRPNLTTTPFNTPSNRAPTPGIARQSVYDI